MALKQSRKSISVRGDTYNRLRQHCDAEHVSMSDVVEGLLAPLLGIEPSVKAEPKPRPAHEDSRRRFNPGPPRKAPLQPANVPQASTSKDQRSRPTPHTTTVRPLDDGFGRLLERL